MFPLSTRIIDQICVTVATISHIRASANGWFFTGYTECIKQTYLAVKHLFECKDGHGTEDPNIRRRQEISEAAAAHESEEKVSAIPFTGGFFVVISVGAARTRRGFVASNPPVYNCLSWPHLIRSLLSEVGSEAFLFLFV
ncbi:uncharacterized protein LOC123895531 isoform X2 [Trifolium pratense]|uniref:uncharacterized protein LOC123895531 isoform X2 n=1 Tax=Trifolium pratense TaxID=57577 RepID=UPI001E690269|nr:uncharacterized protein LOC123895531 isoform X2 [Trifolium pratense]